MIKLYQMATCPFCTRVREALERLDIPYETVEIDPVDRSPVVELVGEPQVPVIVDTANDDHAMNESADIVRYLEERYGEE